MKHLFTLAVASLITISTAHAQSAIDLTGGLFLSDKVINPGKKANDPIIEQLNATEPVLVASFEAGFTHRFFNKLHARIGIGYQKYASRTPEAKDLVWGVQIDSSTVWITEPSGDRTQINRYQIIYRDRYVSIPLSIRYDIVTRRLTPYLEIGIAGNLYHNTRATLKTNVGVDNTTFDYVPIFRDFRISGLLSAGAAYALDEQWQVCIAPSFSYVLTNSVQGFNEHYYNYGLNFSLRKWL